MRPKVYPLGRALVSCVLLTGTCMMAQTKRTGEADFAQYSVSLSFHSKPAKPELSNAEARMFRTRLRYGAAKGPVFADHYAVAVWGCGSGCLQFAIIDCINGHTYFAPWTVSANREVGERLTFHRSSRAMHIIGSLNEKDSADRWYVWDGKALKLVSQKPAHFVDDNGNPLPYPN